MLLKRSRMRKIDYTSYAPVDTGNNKFPHLRQQVGVTNDIYIYIYVVYMYLFI